MFQETKYCPKCKKSLPISASTNPKASYCQNFKVCWSLLNLRPLEWKANRQRPKDGSDISEELRQKILNQVIE